MSFVRLFFYYFALGLCVFSQVDIFLTKDQANKVNDDSKKVVPKCMFKRKKEVV